MSIESGRFVGNSWGFRSFELNMENSCVNGMSKDEFEGYCKVVSDDIADFLPVDPFEMNVKSSVTTIWVEDSDEGICGSNCREFGFDEAEEFNSGDDGVFDDDDDELLVGWECHVGGSVMDNLNVGSVSIQNYCLDNAVRVSSVFDDGSSESKRDGRNYIVVNKGKELQGDGGDPHDALFFALKYLGVKDLLVVESVCRSLRDAVRCDSLLWRSIQIDQPLNVKITDEALVKLTGRAQGTLECLSLVNCFRISDDGLKQVLGCNPKLTKLSVPGCGKLTVDGMLFNLRSLKSAGTLSIKHLRIGSRYGITELQFEDLKSLLGIDNHRQTRDHRPKFYGLESFYVSCEDDCAIDLEMCPRCQKPMLVYDCPAESCQGNVRANQPCRACRVCIARCISCGSCINDNNYEETFLLDFLCLDCLKQLLNCKEKPEVKNASPHLRTIIRQEFSYQVCLYGE